MENHDQSWNYFPSRSNEIDRSISMRISSKNVDDRTHHSFDRTIYGSLISTALVKCRCSEFHVHYHKIVRQREISSNTSPFAYSLSIVVSRWRRFNGGSVNVYSESICQSLLCFLRTMNWPKKTFAPWHVRRIWFIFHFVSLISSVFFLCATFLTFANDLFQRKRNFFLSLVVFIRVQFAGDIYCSLCLCATRKMNCFCIYFIVALIMVYCLCLWILRCLVSIYFRLLSYSVALIKTQLDFLYFALCKLFIFTIAHMQMNETQ